jgi:hypothetical protein
MQLATLKGEIPLPLHFLILTPVNPERLDDISAQRPQFAKTIKAKLVKLVQKREVKLNPHGENPKTTSELLKPRHLNVANSVSYFLGRNPTAKDWYDCTAFL